MYVNRVYSQTIKIIVLLQFLLRIGINARQNYYFYSFEFFSFDESPLKIHETIILWNIVLKIRDFDGYITILRCQIDKLFYEGLLEDLQSQREAFQDLFFLPTIAFTPESLRSSIRLALRGLLGNQTVMSIDR